LAGFRSRGYHTICVGGVGFFNMLTPLGSVLPGLFDESHWSPELGVTDPRSTEHQVDLALRRVAALAVIHDEPARAARLLAAADRLEGTHGPNIHYDEQPLRAELAARVKEALQGVDPAAICDDESSANTDGVVRDALRWIATLPG